MEISCREPEEVSYGSEEQRGSSLAERLQIPLISTLLVTGEQTLAPPSLFVSGRAGLCQTSLICVNKSSSRCSNRFQKIIIAFTFYVWFCTKIPYRQTNWNLLWLSVTQLLNYSTPPIREKKRSNLQAEGVRTGLNWFTTTTCSGCLIFEDKIRNANTSLPLSALHLTKVTLDCLSAHLCWQVCVCVCV